MADRARVRVGAVAYLNTKPLVYRLEEFAPRAELSFAVPSRLADELAAGELDVALIPSVEFFHAKRMQIVSDACIACRGAVLSVKLFFRRPPEQVRRLALDEGSRTSAALARILLAQRYNVAPALESLPIGAALADSDADAVLLIGDRAIHSPPGSFVDVWDLGDEWLRWTDTPFVFAMWVGRPGIGVEEIGWALAAARDAGQSHIEAIAEVEAAKAGLTVPQCVSYLRDNLHFVLGADELKGLQLFYRKAAEMELVPRGFNAWPVARQKQST